jgi:hypothetical protein
MTRQFAVGLALLVAGVGLTALPAGRADIAFAAFAMLWGGFYLMAHRSGATIRRWATLMAACTIWFGIGVASGSLGRWAGSAGAPAAARSEPAHVVTRGADLQAEVRFTGAQFLITNHSPQPWQDVSITVSGAGTGGSYGLHLDRIGPGETMTVQPSRFAAADGQVLNPVRTRPHTLVIAGKEGDGGPEGSYEVGWQ